MNETITAADVGTLSVTDTRPAFRCKNCGKIETADHAGENNVPAACRVCGHGISFDPRNGQKKLEPANWEILADAAPERLAELGLAPDGVARHAGNKTPPVRGEVQVAAGDRPGA